VPATSDGAPLQLDAENQGATTRYMQQQNRLGALRRVHLVWIVKDTESMGWLTAVLRQLEKVRGFERPSPDFASLLNHPTTAETPQAQSDPDFLRISLYLTQRVSPATLANITVHATWEDGTDSITGLNARTQFGRPDFSMLFDKLKSSIEKGSYLPGLESTLRPTVGGEHRSQHLPPRLVCSLAVETSSLLLRTGSSGQGAQRSGETRRQQECSLHIPQGALCEYSP
jgi:hypothetical protein